MNCFDPNTVANTVNLARMPAGKQRILTPNWCSASLVRVEVSFIPDTAPLAVQPITLKAFRFIRSDNYTYAEAGTSTVATTAEINAAQAPTQLYVSFFVDLRNIGMVELDSEASTVAISDVVVSFSVPPTPVEAAPTPKECC